MCHIRATREGSVWDDFANVEKHLSTSSSELTVSDIESAVNRVLNTLLTRKPIQRTIPEASEAVRNDWRYLRQNTDELAQKAYSMVLVHHVLSMISTHAYDGPYGIVYVAIRDLCFRLKLDFGEDEETPLDMEYLGRKVACLLEMCDTRMRSSFYMERLEGASQYKNTSIFISELKFGGLLTPEWANIMAKAISRPLNNLPSKRSTRSGARTLPIWSAIMSGANAWIERTDAEVVQQTLRSGQVCEVQWSRWEGQFREASIVVHDRGLPELSAATLRVAAQIRGAMDKGADRDCPQTAYTKRFRSQEGLTRTPSANVVTTWH